MKKYILGLITGAIIVGSVAYAAIQLQASNISYNNTPLDEVLDDLYTKASGAGGFCKKISGNSTTIGSKYECDPGDGIYRVFYVLKVNTDTVDLIMDRNINKGTLNHSTAMQYIENNNLATSWTNVTVSIPKAADIAKAVGNDNWDVTTTTTSNWFYFDKYNDQYQNSTQVANATNRSEYGWLYQHTTGCETYGCPLNTSLDSASAYGYWLQEKISNDSTNAWRVGRAGSLTYDPVSYTDGYGVRLVITVSKTDL